MGSYPLECDNYWGSRDAKNEHSGEAEEELEEPPRVDRWCQRRKGVLSERIIE